MNDINERPVADLRRNLRAPLIIQKVHLHGERSTIFGYSKNVSRSGMYISTTNPIEAGQQVELEFQLPPPLRGTVRCLCEVVWKRPFGSHLPFEAGMGMKFVDLPVEISEQLDDWVRSQS
ncbi:MAG: PilZ domain-containing protein [Desulfuromonadales bacterium]|nr:PilZ domain-containing protein [Desulfuromonadales bacterium]